MVRGAMIRTTGDERRLVRCKGLSGRKTLEPAQERRRPYLKMQLFAYAAASFALQSPFGVCFIFSHHASLPTLGEQASVRRATESKARAG
jgi:hypothetical protein